MVDIVQHYTTQEAFEKILSDGVLRCSHIRFMNDSKEYIYLLESIEDAIQQKLKGDSIDVHDKKMFEIIASNLRYAKFANAKTHPFIACFSGKPDDLNQWRAYGKSIPGYSIGFQWERLTQIVKEKHSIHTEVKYIEDIGNQYLGDYVKKYTKHTENIYGSEAIYKAAIGQRIADALAEGDQIIGAEYKHRGFNSEEEFRTIFNKVGKEDWKFDTRQTFLKPFIEFHIGKEQIKEIVKEVWVGPNPNKELAIDGAKIFLTHLGFRNVDNIVKGSVIPFRNW